MITHKIFKELNDIITIKYWDFQNPKQLGSCRKIGSKYQIHLSNKIFNLDNMTKIYILSHELAHAFADNRGKSYNKHDNSEYQKCVVDIMSYFIKYPKVLETIFSK